MAHRLSPTDPRPSACWPTPLSRPTNPSCWPPPPPPSSPACSATSCRCSSRRPGSRSRWSPWAPARRWTPPGAAMPTCCWSTTGRPRTSSSPRASAVERRDVMYNDFVLVGPKADPAKVRKAGRTRRCLQAHRRRRHPLRLPRRQERHPRGGAALLEGGRSRSQDLAGYKESGSGMGPTLNMARLDRRLHPVRPRHLARLQEPPGPGDRVRRRPGPVQPLRRHAGEPGQPPAGQEGGRHERSSTGSPVAGRPGGHRRVTRSTGSSCSSPTRK